MQHSKLEVLLPLLELDELVLDPLLPLLEPPPLLEPLDPLDPLLPLELPLPLLLQATAATAAMSVKAARP